MISTSLGSARYFLIEVAQQRGGLLHEIGHFFQQAGIVGDLPVNAFRNLSDLRLHDFTAFGVIENDVVLLQRRQILIGGGDDDIGRTLGARAARDVAAADGRVLERHDLIFQQRDEPAQRPAERNAIAGPAHGLLKLQRGDQFRQQRGKHFTGGLARIVLLGVNVLIALLFDFDQIVDIDALPARKAFGGFGGLAIFVEGGLGRRAAHHRIERRLLRREVAHEEALPPWGGKALDRVVFQAGVLQHLRREFAQLRQRRSDISRR